MKSGKRCGKDEGSALLTVMGVILLVAILAAGMVALARQQVYSAQRTRDYVKAQIIAEAGANATYSVLKTNFAARSDVANFPLTYFDGGTYDADVTSVSSNLASIICTGYYGKAKAVVGADVRNYPTVLTNNTPPMDNAYAYAIVSGGNLSWAGNVDMQMSNGWMHCNGSYSANGANHIYGNVASHVQIGMVGNASINGTGKAPVIASGTITYPVTTNVPLVTIPNIDLTPYYNWALANGQVFSGSKSLSGTVTPAGGVLWVNGTLSFGNGLYTGCFIATGDIELKTTGQGTIEQVKVAQYPAIVSRDGDITIKQAKTFTFHGLIYCKTGNFDKQGNGEVVGLGTIMTAGDFSKNGGWSGMFYENSAPVPPGGNVTLADCPVIKAWK